jgi:hypothetical protein
VSSSWGLWSVSRSGEWSKGVAWMRIQFAVAKDSPVLSQQWWPDMCVLYKALLCLGTAWIDGTRYGTVVGVAVLTAIGSTIRLPLQFPAAPVAGAMV